MKVDDKPKTMEKLTECLKSHVEPSNEVLVAMKEVEDYIKGLKTLEGVLIIKSGRKSGFLGFLNAMIVFRYPQNRVFTVAVEILAQSVGFCMPIIGLFTVNSLLNSPLNSLLIHVKTARKN